MADCQDLMHPLNVDDLVKAVAARLRQARIASVFAVWPDGSVSEEAEGFTFRTHSNGTRQEPLAAFTAPIPVHPPAIRVKIERGLRDRGLLPPR